jgi:Ni,Fe-hydrogenase I large subunit
MAHFAELDESNVVTRVIVVHNNELKGANGVEYEEKGIDFCESLYGHRNWAQTSYNNNFKKQFAGVGYTYDSDKDVFIEPSPHPSWTLNESLDWVAPVEKPDESGLVENQYYAWYEDSQTWEIENSPINDDTE